jgi:S-adenosylmethionine:tRNA ribosyltransferase-isomerase
LLKPVKRIKAGSVLIFADGEIQARVLENTLKGLWLLEFSKGSAVLLKRAGKVPLPHYIKKEISDENQYQTVYAQKEGAIAAPTAGLHFTENLLGQLKKLGIVVVKVTLHCGLATFRPVKTSDIRQHNMESEWIEASAELEQAVNSAKAAGLRVIAVGTTSIRALESMAFTEKDGKNYIKSFSGQTNLYITPGYNFKIIDAVLTNFHTPYSTNLILVSTFCGLELTRRAYAYAIKEKFRFYSFGDAMLIL